MAYSFQYDRDDDAFRHSVRDFVESNLPPDMASRNETAVHTTYEDFLGWQAILSRRGWSVPHWPVEYGGTGWSAKQLLIFEEECMLAGAPPPNSQAVFMLAPILHAFATDAQKQRFLPDIREGKVLWAQGFSEPNAGSDLASLKTRAVPCEGGWKVNGQKIWTSLAHMADWIFLLVKTDTTVKPQAGISFMVVERKVPGVTVRPIPGIDGHATLCETFFDDVFIPSENVIGEIGRGWDYAKYLLGKERISGADTPRNKLHLKRLRDLAWLEQPNGAPLANQYSFAALLAKLEVEVDAVEVTTLRALCEIGDTSDEIPMASILKLCGTELLQKLAYAQVEALGCYGAVDYFDDGAATFAKESRPPGPAHAVNVASEALYRRATTVYAGSSEIQRTIVAKALLRLEPRGVGNTIGTLSSFLVDAAQRFVDKRYDFETRHKAANFDGTVAKEHWSFFAEMGWLGVGLPEAHGGLGGSAFDTAALLEVFGGALVVEPYVAVAILAAQAITHAAPPDQRETLMPGLISGDSIVVLAHDEPAAGGRVEWIQTRAEPTADGYVLNGRKVLVVGAGLADKLIVAARTSGAADDKSGISLLMVPLDAKGLERSDYRTLDGRIAADFVFNDVRLDRAALLGSQDGALPSLSTAVDHAIMATCAELLGAMTSAFWMTRDYLLVRNQFGAPLASFQALQHRLADMYLEIEQARSTLYLGLAALEADDASQRRRSVSGAKWRVTKAAHFVCGQAIQLHGGIGMTEECAVGHFFKRRIVVDSQFGSARSHLDRVIAESPAHRAREKTRM